MQHLLCRVVQLYVLCLVGRAILSYFPAAQSGAFAAVSGFLFRITEPLLGPLRRIVPRVGMFDLSFLVAIIGLQILQSVVCSI